MKTKYIIIVVAIVLVTIACFVIARSCNEPKPEIIAAVDSTQYFQNKYQQEVAARKQRESDFAMISKAYKDSMADLHNTKADLLQEITILTQHGKATVPALSDITIDTDTTGGITFGKTYAPIKGNVYPSSSDTGIGYYTNPPGVYISGLPSGSTSKDQIISQKFENNYYKVVPHIYMGNPRKSYVDIETFDTLSYVVKEVKEGGLFKRTTFIQAEATNSNKSNRIIGLAVFRKELPKPKKFGVGFQAGYGFSNSLKPSPYIGVGITYLIIRF